MNTIDWPPPRSGRRTGGVFLVAALIALVLGASATLSFYVDSLWFGSLGFGDVFWTRLRLQTAVFTAFILLTFLILYGSFLLLKPARLESLTGPILINGQPLRLPVEPVLRIIAVVIALFVAVVTGFGMSRQWLTFALAWYGADASAEATLDPIFGRPVAFYFFTLPAWQLIAGWLTTLAVIVCGLAAFFAVLTGGTRVLTRQTSARTSLRGVSATLAAVLLAFAIQVYLGRYGRILADHTVFSGVTYSDANVWILGMLLVAAALAAGSLLALVTSVVAPRVRWLIASAVPAAACYLGVSLIAWYVSGFVVRPNELAREREYISHNIAFTRQAFGLHRIEQVQFPADAGIEALDAANNQESLENIRLWDWRALQDTLDQIQEIRTYYDFPDVDIDRYEVEGRVRQMMLATRELNVDRLPESSRNWINQKLVYTHGYGITMNPANGFTPEGLPDLLLSNMPMQHRVESLKVTRPEIYFGELTSGDVYVKTGQPEFNYPEGDSNSTTSYEGTGGIELGGLLRRLVIALDRGDLTRLPFSDDVTSESRLLMRRNIRERVAALAPFLTFDPDPYIVLTSEGRLVWLLDGFTMSGAYPYSRHYVLGGRRINYLRNSVKATIDAYDGMVTFYVFEDEDPIVAAYRKLFPTLFRDRSAMPADLVKHIRYPELLLEIQAAVYGLYHVTDPEVFYKREDLWSVATEVGMTADRQQAAQTMEPNYVLMKLPGSSTLEFVEILPFTPANRNNLIGWIAGRSDGPDYGKAVAYHFPETRLVDGPLQIEARIDQNAQLSSQLTLWNQQGSSVRRGSLIVIPIGRALFFAEPIYLQAERSPMPELRIVVVAVQDRLAYGPTFDTAMASLFGSAPSSPTPQPTAPPAPAAAGATRPPVTGPPSAAELDSLVSDLVRDLSEYQRLTAEGRLGEAGQRLEALKQRLEQMQGRRR
jgi:hypothetical protein